MISIAYEMPDFQIFEFCLEDVITASQVVHTTTTTAPTTLPGTTAGKFEANGGSGDAHFDFSDYFG